MKKEELKKILPEITDEQLDSVMNLHGNSVKDYKITIETLKSDIEVNKGIIKNQREKIGELENVDIEQIKNTGQMYLKQILTYIGLQERFVILQKMNR